MVGGGVEGGGGVVVGGAVVATGCFGSEFMAQPVRRQSVNNSRKAAANFTVVMDGQILTTRGGLFIKMLPVRVDAASKKILSISGAG